MHNVLISDKISLNNDNTNSLSDLPHVRFSEQQNAEQLPLADLIRLKIESRKYFYGVELSAKSYVTNEQLPPTELDYRSFGSILPLFTSLVWFGPDYCNVKQIENVDAVRLCQRIQSKTIVMPHFTCYRTDRERLKNFLSLNFTNILVLRGDEVESDQSYLHAADLVTEIRQISRDTISIGVGGYPQGHPESNSQDEDMEFLVQKINSGADFIITQHCLSSEKIIDFVKNCRENGIIVPIIIGVYVPENFGALQQMCKITRVQLPENEFVIYKSLQDDLHKFREFAIQQTVRMIEKVFRENIGIFGIHFFTMNKFESTQIVINELMAFFGDQNSE